MKKFKINKTDVCLLAGFIFCSLTILYLSYSVGTPLEHVRTGVAWTTTGVRDMCYYNGLSWPARNHVCYTEDMPK